MPASEADDSWENDRSSTVGWPRWLTIATLLLVVARVALAALAITSPAAVSPAALAAMQIPVSAERQLELVEIVSPATPGTDSLDRMLSTNRAVRELLLANYSFKRVVYDKEDGESNTAVLVKRYKLKPLPALVVFLPTGEFVSKQEGHDSSQISYQFLKTALKEQFYVRGRLALTRGDFKNAAKNLQEFVTRSQGNYARSRIASVFLSLCLSAEGRSQEAQAAIADLKMVDELSLPTFICAQYLKGEITEQRLFELSPGWATSRLIVGLKHLADGDNGGARVALMWVIDHADPKSADYDMAKGILSSRLGVTVPPVGSP